MKHNYKQEYVPGPLHCVRLQLDNNVNNTTRCIMYTPEYKYGAHTHPTQISLPTNQGIYINTFVQQLSDFVNKEISKFGCRFMLLEAPMAMMQNTCTPVRKTT